MLVGGELEKVAPTLPGADVADGRPRNSEPLSQFNARQIAGPDEQHVISRKPDIAHTSSLSRFAHIVSLRSCVKMCRLDADWPVAPMQNPRLVGGDWIVWVEDSMSDDVGVELATTHHYLTISVAETCAPVPTFTGGRRIARHKPCESLRLTQSARPSKAFTCKGISVSSKALVMGHAKARPLRGPVTNGTCHAVE